MLEVLAFYGDGTSSQDTKTIFVDRVGEQPTSFMASFADHTYTISLRDGVFGIDGDAVGVDYPTPTEPLRLVYFKRMEWTTDSDEEPWMLFFVVGWQTTVDGKNVKRGLKVAPDGSWEMVDDFDA